MELDGKQVRIAVIGSSSVGKTCLIKRFTENTFQGSQYNPTPGVDFASRRITIKPLGTATLIIIDVGGNAITSKMLNIYLTSSIDIFLLVYDVTNLATLNELRKWLDILQAFNIDKSEASLALVGCKADLEHLRTVRLDGHTRFAQEFGIPLPFVVSAKSGESVLACFTNCAIYHLNPDSKHRIREHALVQSQLPRRLSTVPKGPHVLPHPMPAPTSTVKNPGVAATVASSATPQNKNEPNSVVCNIQ